MADPTAAQRRMLAKMKLAMPDGSYYVRNGSVGADDLDNAIKAVGRGVAAGDDGDAIRRHIMTRAAALKLTDRIPDTWNADGSLKHEDTDVEEFLRHFGVKGMHWGVRRDQTGSSDAKGATAPAAKAPSAHEQKKAAAKQAKHDQLLETAAAHDRLANEHVKLANNYKKEANEVAAKGLRSKAGERVYGPGAADLGQIAFYGAHGQAKGAAVDELYNNLRMAHNIHIRAANSHYNKADRLRAKAGKLEHADESDFDLFVDGDQLLHFGVKGMHWGVRKQKGEASAEHMEVARIKAKVKAGGGTHVLTNAELKTLTDRLNLETNYTRLKAAEGDHIKNGEQYVRENVNRVKLAVDAYNTGKAVYGIANDVNKALKK